MGEGLHESFGETKRYESVFHPETNGLRYTHAALLLPGIGERGDSSLRALTASMAALGYDSCAVNHLTTQMDKKTLVTLRSEKEEAGRIWKQKHANTISEQEAERLLAAFPLTEFRKVQADMQAGAREISEETRGRGLNLVGHSQGGAQAILSAFWYPEHVHKVALINSAGLTEEDRFWLRMKFHTNFAREVVEGFKRGKMPAHVPDTFFTLAARKFGHYFYAIEEGNKLAELDLYPYIAALHRIAPNISIKTFYDKGDKLFFPESVERRFEMAKIRFGEKAVGELEQTELGGHYSPSKNPDSLARKLNNYFEPERMKEAA